MYLLGEAKRRDSPYILNAQHKDSPYIKMHNLGTVPTF